VKQYVINSILQYLTWVEVPELVAGDISNGSSFT